MKTEAETAAVIEDVLNEVDSSFLCGMSASDYTREEHKRCRRKAEKYGVNFAARMNGAAPYRTEAEACEALAPIALWIFGQLARRFAIWVIKRLWARWHSAEGQ